MVRGTSTRGYLPTVDGWRAVAISRVILSHLFFGTSNHAYFSAVLVLMGPKGVSLFFGLSGFLITWRLLEEQQKYGHINLRRFYLRRAFRILPAAIVYLFVIAGLGLIGVFKVDTRSWMSAMFFYRDYSNTTDWLTGHFWTLSIEEHFYLFWPVMLLFLGISRAAWSAAFMSLAVVGWRAIDLHYHWTENAMPDVGYWFRTDTRLDALLVACIIAILFHHFTDGGRRRVEFPTWVWVGLLVGYFTFGLMPRYTSSSSFFELGQVICIPLLLAGTLLNPHWTVSKILECKALKWIGCISYSLFLWQQIFLGNGKTGHVLLRLAAVGACAIASFYLIEKPMIRVGRRFAATGGTGRLALETSPRLTRLRFEIEPVSANQEEQPQKEAAVGSTA